MYDILVVEPLCVWFMTGTARIALAQHAAELGALGVLLRPFDHPALAARLDAGFAAIPENSPS